MSISSAPSSTAERTSASLTSVGYWPDGKPLATDATFTWLPPSRSFACGTRLGYTQTAATAGIVGSASGRIAFEQRAETFPGVSAPSSVVRSIIRTARSSAQSLASFLIDRFASDPARSSSATASMEPTRGIVGSSGSSKPAGRAGALAIKMSVAPVRPEAASARGLDLDRLHSELEQLDHDLVPLGAEVGRGDPHVGRRQLAQIPDDDREHAALELEVEDDPRARGGLGHARMLDREHQIPNRSSRRSSRRQRGLTFTCRSRNTLWPTSASISGRARVPISLIIRPPPPTTICFCESVST